MAGIYIHIPFCRKACHYCDFHFSTNLSRKAAFLAALCNEIALQANYLSGATIDTIYFGGGTPSLLTADELNMIFAALRQYFSWAATAEITLEANPDDLTDDYLLALRQTPINRLSIGIQSFSDTDLQAFNRAHTAAEATRALDRALHFGFANLSVDLIYGAPTTTAAQWQHNLATLAQLPIAHLSCYALTVEPKTALATMIKKGTAPPLLDDTAVQHWLMLQNWLPAAGFEQYEISNFARNGQYAQHNTAYWQGTPYLGIGASAHSFNGVSRQWNVANNALYINALQNNTILFEKEILTERDRINEYIMTALRTKWGCALAHITGMSHDTTTALAYIKTAAAPYIANNWLFCESETLYLTTQGKLHADAIAADLFVP